MARLARLTAGGVPHHVIQRGNDRQDIVLDDVDRQRVLDLLRDAAQAQRVAVHAYALMSNHVHLLVTPAEAGAVGRLMQAFGRGYVRWFNRRHDRTGGLFEGRYRSALVETERYLLACARYIELNPVRAGLVADPGHYRWSSYRHHVGDWVDSLIDDHPLYWALGNTPFERQGSWRGFISMAGPADELTAIRQTLNGGWALGQVPTGVRRARPAPRGRPRKSPRPPAA